MTEPVLRIRRPSPVTLEQHVASEIRAQMARLGVTQLAVAEALGMSDGELSRRLNGGRPLKLNFVEEICQVLQMNPVELFDWIPPRPPNPRNRRPRKQVSGRRELPHLDSNQKPTGLRPRQEPIPLAA